MPLIKNGQIIADRWVRVEDDADLPASGDILVSFERFKDGTAAFTAREGRTGVVLSNDTEPEELKPHLKDIDLVALTFPAFTDGRAYSQARQIRTQLGFKGELRAIGNVLADQAAFMIRVGFDAFEVDESQSVDVWNSAKRSMSVAYQRGYEGEQLTRGSTPA